MKKMTILLILIVLVTAQAFIWVYKWDYDRRHVFDKPFMELMNYIVVNHPTCFDARYTNLVNWDMTIPDTSNYFRTIPISGLPEAEMGIFYNSMANNYLGHFEANTTCGFFIWDGAFWNNNYSVTEFIYSITK